MEDNLKHQEAALLLSLLRDHSCTKDAFKVGPEA
jgi:hypothetical protein